MHIRLRLRLGLLHLIGHLRHGLFTPIWSVGYPDLVRGDEDEDEKPVWLRYPTPPPPPGQASADAHGTEPPTPPSPPGQPASEDGDGSWEWLVTQPESFPLRKLLPLQHPPERPSVLVANLNFRFEVGQ